MTTKAMVILSGGQDSTTVLFWAMRRYDEVHAVTFDYGQKHRIELAAARTVAEMAGAASHEIVRVPGILRGRSPLVDSSVELETYTDFASMDEIIGDRVETTFVPMRNLLFVVLAANRAICSDIRTLVTGVCQADNANYPDCRASFVDKAEQALTYALGLDKRGFGPCFEIVTPLMDLSKAETVRLAALMPDCWRAMAYTHTAYDGCYPPSGRDHASTLRARGFEEAGLPDPLVLRAWREGLMRLPASANYDATRDAALQRACPI